MNEIIDLIWDGYCPESFLQGKKTRMRLNEWDFYESEDTGLQICLIPGVQAVILNFRGEGKFRLLPNYAHEIEKGEILSPQNLNVPPFNNSTLFADNLELINYLNHMNIENAEKPKFNITPYVNNKTNSRWRRDFYLSYHALNARSHFVQNSLDEWLVKSDVSISDLIEILKEFNPKILTQELIKSFFDRIEAAKQEADLILILNDSLLEEFKMDLNKYPKLKFKITNEELGDFDLDSVKWEEKDFVTKLLYSLVWKRGDLLKLKHIVQGIKNGEKSDRITFYQFGKHLSDSDSQEPIIDQHVIRAFQFKEGKPEKPIQDNLTLTHHKFLIEGYKKWLNTLDSSLKPHLYLIDQILYALGKRIKKEINQKSAGKKN